MSWRNSIQERSRCIYGELLGKVRARKVFSIRSLKEEIWGADVLGNLTLKHTQRTDASRYEQKLEWEYLHIQEVPRR
jgi:hypothetical protein